MSRTSTGYAIHNRHRRSSYNYFNTFQLPFRGICIKHINIITDILLIFVIIDSLFYHILISHANDTASLFDLLPDCVPACFSLHT